MRRASISETKNRLSALIDEVRQGTQIIITDRGKPVARLVPIVPSDGSEAPGRIARLERSGLVMRPQEPGDASTGEPVDLGSGMSVLEALLREREQGR